jgi:MFS family permease
VVSQIPAGALVDAMATKRLAAAAGIFGVIAAALLLALKPMEFPVMLAELLHGAASSLFNPAVAAISLRLVGYAALGERLGRNASFASIGSALAAGVMGGIGTYLAGASVFWLTAGLGVPALLALCFIAPGTHRGLAMSHPVMAAQEQRRHVDWRGLRVLLTDRRLLAFAACAALFHLSNAAMLPLAATQVTREAGDLANLTIAGCIIVPQVIVAIASPWVGHHANRWGRRPILLLGWSALPLRAVLLALLPGPSLLVAGQAISGISAAVFGVMLPLVAADLTRDRGHFNLCLGIFGVCVFGGAAISTSMAGWIADNEGYVQAFLALAACGLAGTLLLWLAMPETEPPEIRNLPAQPVPSGN